MKQYTQEELQKILELHVLWTRGEGEGGTRANLRYADLTNANLTGADLTNANLTDADLTGADLRYADLTGADLRYANLTNADLRYANLTDADLTNANLTDADLTGADLRYANLTDANLTDADLTNANLTDANLTGADLTNANLTNANLTDACIPIVENIDQKILAVVEAGEGQLEMSSWHNSGCNTAHCRAGWAIHFAGEAGYALEKSVGSAAAGALIYAVSCPTLPIPDFYASNEEALSDIQTRAGKGC